MNHLFLVASIILFILVAIFFFWADGIAFKTELGLLCVGLACFAAAHLPLAEWRTRV